MGINEPIRVLQVVTHMERGGLETMLMNYYRNIDREKVQFDFLVHRSQRAAYDDEIEALGGTIHRLARLVPWSRSYRNALDAFFAAHKEYRVVHVHQDCLSSVILKAAKKHGIPVRIAHSHSSSQDKDMKYPIKLLYKRWIPKYATGLLACGALAGDWMFDGAPYHIVHNAIDTALYRFNPGVARCVRQELSISHDAWVVGHVGRFSWPKNHSFLLDVFSEIRKRRPEAVLVLVGDGELRSQVEEKIKALGLENSVILTGVRSDVPRMLQAMDAFLFPSLYEGVPVTMVEAQASGLPCYISKNVPPECKMTELVQSIDLSQSSAEWAEKILASENARNLDTLQDIQKAGYDIKENAVWLQNYYLGAANGSR